LYSRKWLLVATWILSIFGILAGLSATAFHFWRLDKSLSFGSRAGNLTFGFTIWLILLFNVALWTLLPATICLVLLWGSRQVPLRAKVSGSIAVCLAWLGMLTLVVWRDVRL
jgi:hypothetical protein